MLNTPPTNPALNDLLTYLQKVSVLGGRDRLDFRRRGSGPAHLWLPEMVAGKAASVAELTTGGWTSFDLPGVRDATDPVRLCYDTLGRMLERARDVTRVAEVRFGVGVLSRNGEGQNVCYPMISCPAAMILNDREGIEVKISGGEWRTEGRVLKASLTGKTEVALEVVQKAVSEMESFETVSEELLFLKKLLTRHFGNLEDGSVDFDTRNEAPEEVSEERKIYFSPVLYLREGRENEYAQFVGQMLDRLQSDETLSLPLLNRVVEGYREVTEGQDEIAPFIKYLPLPSSREQRRIAEEIGCHELVLVQGPPGTGKSYAIANLLGPLLMAGQGVLITAEREQALEAISNQVPKPLRPFVFLTSTKVATIKSGRAILRLLESFDRGREERIQRLKLDEIELLDVRKRALLKVLKTDPLKADVRLNESYAGELHKLTERLAEEKKRFGWFKDEVGDLEEYSTECIRDFQKWQRLIEELRLAGFDGGSAVVPDIASLPNPEDLRVYRNLRDEFAKTYYGRSSLPIPGVTASQVKAKLSRLREWHGAVPPHRWAVTAGRELGDATSSWRELAEDTRRYLAEIDLLDPETIFRDHVIEIDGEAEGEEVFEYLSLHPRPRHKKQESHDLKFLQADLNELIEWFGSSDKLSKVIKGLYAKRYQRLGYLFREIKVNGRVGETRRHFELVARHTSLLLWLERLDTRWGEYAVYEIDSAAKLRAYRVYSRTLLSMIERNEAFRADLEKLEEWYGMPSGHFYAAEHLTELENNYSALAAKEAVAKAGEMISRGLEELGRYAPGIDYVAEAARCLSETDISAYLNVYPRLVHLNTLQDRYTQQLTVEEELGSLFSKTIKHFKGKPRPSSPEGEVVRAVNHAHAVAALDKLCGLGESGPLNELRELEDNRLRHVEQYVVATVKLKFVGGLHSPARFKSNLKIWLKAEEEGKSRKKGLVDQEVSDTALGYILDYLPCLAMTVEEVTKRLHPEPEKFDVLIVDEASQLSAAALSMLYLAKRAVVIGDDKQISPQHDFVRDELFEEVQHLVAELPQGAFFRKGNSFFDHVKLVAAKEIQLREHFRCQPEIIAFSDSICYGGEDEEVGLLPLRQASKGRLSPLATVYVPNAEVKENRNKNAEEAKRLVAYLLDLIEDGAYMRKTVGVITLLGDHQHRLIEKLLGESGIPPKERETRRLKVGKPADFQGDERDVILLSLVTAPNKVSNIPWKATFTQRFNVAMSRAKDQVVLFHSKTLAELPTGNLQQLLLSHCQDYKIERSLSKADLPVQDNDKELPPGFRSVLQFEVAQNLSNHGYALLLDYSLGSLVIDLVVERSDGQRIALYCLDPSTYHDSEMRERLVEQQLILQRVEWLVYEINGCHFGHNSGAVMERVIDFIEETG